MALTLDVTRKEQISFRIDPERIREKLDKYSIVDKEITILEALETILEELEFHIILQIPNNFPVEYVNVVIFAPQEIRIQKERRFEQMPYCQSSGE